MNLNGQNNILHSRKLCVLHAKNAVAYHCAFSASLMNAACFFLFVVVVEEFNRVNDIV